MTRGEKEPKRSRPRASIRIYWKVSHGKVEFAHVYIFFSKLVMMLLKVAETSSVRGMAKTFMTY